MCIHKMAFVIGVHKGSEENVAVFIDFQKAELVRDF